MRQNYRVPDVLDLIYGDIVNDLYFKDHKFNRIKLIKCNIACDILLKSSESEEYIVENVGFPTIKEFREAFHSYLGIYPLEFRRRYK